MGYIDFNKLKLIVDEAIAARRETISASDAQKIELVPEIMAAFKDSNLLSSKLWCWFVETNGKAAFYLKKDSKKRKTKQELDQEEVEREQQRLKAQQFDVAMQEMKNLQMQN